MKFRQRVAWLLLVLYFAASFSVLYYTFEINDHYNNLALDHHNTYHKVKSPNERTSMFGTVWHHVTDVALPVWLMVFLLPYLQMFGMLLAWTRAEPRMSFAYMWPGIVYARFQNIRRSCQGHHISKPINSVFVQNGYVIIDT